MEKIYMEESQQSQRQKSGKLDFSVVLSFAVAIFAVFSIGTFAVVSNQGSSVSYAAPTNDSFSLILNDAYGSSKAAGIKGLVESSASFYVPLYYAGTEDFNHLVFCVEAALRSVENGSNYTKGNTITDPGLIYILSHSYANNQPIVNDHSNYKDYVEIFATQAAVWAYLNGKGENTNLPSSGIDSLAVLKTVDHLVLAGGPDSGNTIYTGNIYSKIEALVNEANDASEVHPQVTVKKASDSMSKTADGKFYQTSIITVTGAPAGNFKSYDIRVSGIKGAKVVDENGKDLALTNVAVGKKFYVRIPASEVKETVQKLKVEVTGHFDLPGGVYYTSTGKQTLSTITVVSTPGYGEEEFDVVGVPDTGMNTAQTIYFIGLIVLLCGVGIVYANAKPVQSKQ